MIIIIIIEVPDQTRFFVLDPDYKSNIQTHKRLNRTLFIMTKSPRFCVLGFVIINSVILNLLCGWIIVGSDFFFFFFFHEQ